MARRPGLPSKVDKGKAKGGKILLRLPTELHAEIARISNEENLSINSIGRQLFEEYVRNHNLHNPTPGDPHERP